MHNYFFTKLRYPEVIQFKNSIATWVKATYGITLDEKQLQRLATPWPAAGRPPLFDPEWHGPGINTNVYLPGMTYNYLSYNIFLPIDISKVATDNLVQDREAVLTSVFLSIPESGVPKLKTANRKTAQAYEIPTI